MEKATSSLKDTETRTEQQTVAVSNATDAVNLLRKQIEEEKAEIKKERELLQKTFEEKMKKFEQLEESLKPLMKLPEAFAQSLNSNPEQVRNGVAKKVNNILGYNKDKVKEKE